MQGGMVLDAVGEGQVGAGVAGCGGGEVGAEGEQGLAASGRSGGIEPNVQGVADDLQVAGEGERLPAQGACLVLAAGAVRAQQPGQGGFGVVGARRWRG